MAEKCVRDAAVKISIKQTRGLTARAAVIYAKRFDTNGNESIQRYGKPLFVIAALRYFAIRLAGTAGCDKDTLLYVLRTAAARTPIYDIMFHVE